jgi:Sulfotransferase family
MSKAQVCPAVRSEPLGHSRSKAPVFVVGCPRSGTTLAYHILLSAGNFAIYRAESQVFNLLEPRFGDLSIASRKRALLTAWYTSPLFTKTGLNADEIEACVMSRCRNGGDFLRLVMEAMARQQGAERWADCTPEHLLYLERIKETIPEALIVHVLRDGRDVSLSLEKQGWIRPFRWHREHVLEVSALYWNWIVRRGRAVGHRLGQDYLELQYEKLVEDPRGSMVSLGDFIEQKLDYDNIQKTGIGTVQRPNTSFSLDLQSGAFQPVARWKHRLSADQQATLDALVGDTLEELGYAKRKMQSTSRHRASLQRMRSLYNAYFSTKLFLKSRTSLGRVLVSRDLSWT